MSRHGSWAAMAAVLLTALELGFANGWLVQTAPVSFWQEPSEAAAKIAQREHRRASAPPTRIHRQGDSVAAAWQDCPDEARPAEAIRWWRDTLWPKFNTRERIAVVQLRGSLLPSDYEIFLDESRRWSEEAARPTAPPPTGGNVDLSPALDALGARYVLRPSHPSGAQLFENHTALPRAWIVHEVETVPPVDHRDPGHVRTLTRRLFAPDGGPRDLRRTALVETSHPFSPPVADTRQSNAARTHDRAQRPAGQLTESCHIVHYDLLRVELEVALAQPGLVVLSDLYYPGWKLDVLNLESGEARPAKILRTNRIMRGVWLPAGMHRLVYRYRPASFMVGAVLSGAGWILLGALVWRQWRRTKGATGGLPASA